MIPKQSVKDIEKCIGKYLCRAPDREGGGGRGTKQTKENENSTQSDSEPEEEYAFQNGSYEHDEET